MKDITFEVMTKSTKLSALILAGHDLRFQGQILFIQFSILISPEC